MHNGFPTGAMRSWGERGINLAHSHSTSSRLVTTAQLPPISGFVWNFFCSHSVPSTLDRSAVSDLRQRTPKMARVEAVLFVADEPIALKRLQQLATLADVTEAKEIIDRLNAAYDATYTPAVGAVSNYLVQYGMEFSPIAINEVLAAQVFMNKLCAAEELKL